jgi:hypothetical protein
MSSGIIPCCECERVQMCIQCICGLFTCDACKSEHIHYGVHRFFMENMIEK